MRRLRVLVIALAVLALGLGGWRLYVNRRGTGVIPAAPSFIAAVFGKGGQVAFPGDYAGSWVWLMFSGAD